jgi:lauroyl/myristoyl acyltransferase
MQLKKNIFLGLIDHYFEKMWNIHSPLEEFCEYIKGHTLIENRTWLDHSLKEDRGVLLISGHFGGIEYMTITLSVHGYKPVIIARFKTTKLIERTLPRAKATNIEVINADEKNVFFKAVRALKKGKILITLCDEFSRWIPCDDKSITVFGECVLQDKTLDILHRRVKVPTCLGLMRRGKNGYELEIFPIAISANQQNKPIGELSWKLLEQFILQDPGQWYQWHEMVDTLRNYKQRRNQIEASVGLMKASEIVEPGV